MKDCTYLNDSETRGKYQPRCSDNGCWELYWRSNPGKVLAAKKAIDTFGEDVVIRVQGEDFYETTRGERQLEYMSGKRQTEDPGAIKDNRGLKYVRHLKSWLAQHPVEVLA